jgi:hypothetical protein
MIVGGVVMVLVAIAVSASTDLSPPDTSPPPCVDFVAGTAAQHSITADLHSVARAIQALEVEEAVSHLRDAARHAREAADATLADPSISGPMEAAAGYFEQAADAMAAGQMTQSSSLITLAAGKIDESSTAGLGAIAPVCN